MARRHVVYGAIALAGIWFAWRWTGTIPPIVFQTTDHTIQGTLGRWLWDGRYLIGLVVAVILHPQVISRPFRLAQGVYSRGLRRSHAERLAAVYYFFFVGFGSLFFLWLQSSTSWRPMAPRWGTDSALQTASAQQWMILAGLLFIVLINARFCWQFGHYLRRQSLEFWTGFAALASLQMALLSWIDMEYWRDRIALIAPMQLPKWSSLKPSDWLNGLEAIKQDLPVFASLAWRTEPAMQAWLEAVWRPWLVLLVVSLPITSLALAWLGPESGKSRWRPALTVLLASMLISALASLPPVMPHFYWLGTGAAIACMALTMIMGAVSSHRRGFLTHVYRRYYMHQKNLESSEQLRTVYADSRQLSLLGPLVRLSIQIALLVANLIMEIARVTGNAALFAILWLIELLVRIPEMIGASLVRVLRAAHFYVQYLLIPAIMYAGTGIGVSSFALALSSYHASGLTRFGVSIILSLIGAVLSLSVGMASLFELTPGLVMKEYLKWEADEFQKTPIGYLTYLLLSLWLLQSLGLLVSWLLWPELFLTFQPGLFYFLETLLVLSGIALLVGRLIQSRKRGR